MTERENEKWSDGEAPVLSPLRPRASLLMSPGLHDPPRHNANVHTNDKTFENGKTSLLDQNVKSTESSTALGNMGSTHLHVDCLLPAVAKRRCLCR
jgi:hypothetical protein